MCCVVDSNGAISVEEFDEWMRVHRQVQKKNRLMQLSLVLQSVSVTIFDDNDLNQPRELAELKVDGIAVGLMKRPFDTRIGNFYFFGSIQHLLIVWARVHC
jgi:hypothetical protein